MLRRPTGGDSQDGPTVSIAGRDAAVPPPGEAKTPNTPLGPRASAAAAPARQAELPLRTRGRYDLIEAHGQGGLGCVWKARDLELDRIVALKEVIPSDEGSRARFVREALVTARLEHPAIVPVHEAGRWDSGQPFYVMKLVSGRTLRDVAEEKETLAERLSLLPSIIAVADAVAYAHAQGVLHRDLKPANVLVGDFGETVVIDWGLAKDLHADETLDSLDRPALGSPDAAATEAGSVLGTPSFMAPEQARGEPVDERADVYALGGLLYYVLSGKTPLAGRGLGKGASDTQILEMIGDRTSAPLGALVPGVPQDLADIVDKAMRLDRAERYATAGEMAQDLKRFQTGQLVRAHAYSLPELVRRWVARHRAIAIASALFAAVAAAGGAAFLLREQRLRRVAEVERDRADAKTLALLEQQGRDELDSGHPIRAAVYLAEAYRRQPHSLALRALVTEAVRPMERLERSFTGHARDIPFVAYDPAGTRFVTASSDGTSRVWSADDGRLLAELRGGDGFVDAATFSPDGTLVAAATDRAVRIFRAEGGPAVRTIDDREAYRVWFTPDGKRLIVGTQRGVLRLRDAESGAVIAERTVHTDRISDLVFSPDGARFAVASWDQVATIWDVATFQPVVTLKDHESPVSAVAYSRDGAWLATVESDVYVHVRRADTGARVRTLRLPEGARFSRATFTPDGQALATRSQDGVVRVWHASSGQLLTAFDAQPFGKLMCSAVSPDGKALVTTGVAGAVHMWRLDRPDWRLLDHPFDHGDYARSEYTFDGAHVVTGEEDGTVTLWSAETGKPRSSFKVEGNAFAMVPNHDATRVAVMGTLPANLPPGLWDPTSGRRVASLEGMKRLVTHVAVSRDGRAVALTSSDGSLRLFDADTGAPERTMQVDRLRLTAVAFHPGGAELAASDEHGRVHIFDRASGRELRAIDAHVTWIQDVAYSHDGARLVTAGRQDHTAKIWDAASGRLLVTLSGHHDNLMRASFSPDDRLVATSGMDYRAIVWDAATGEIVRTLRGPSYTAVFAPRGDALFTTGNYGYAVFWDLALDARSPEALAAFVAERSPWQLVDGRLRLR